MVFKRYLFLIFFSFFSFYIQASEYIVFSNVETTGNIGKNISFFRDSVELTFKDVLARKDAFYSSNDEILRLGVSDKYSWVRIPVENQSESDKLQLHVDFPILDEICFYKEIGNQEYTELCTGEYLPFSSRQNQMTTYSFDLDLKKGEKKVYYLRVKSGEEMNLPISISSKEQNFRLVEKEILSGIYFGIILVMLFYNLFIYYTTKNIAYAYYVLYIFFVGMVQFCLHGYAFKYFWPNSPEIAIHSIYVINALTAFFSIFFFRHFINAKELIPKWNKGFIVFIGIYIVEVSLAFLGQYNAAYHLMNLGAMLLSFYLIVVSIIAIRKKSRAAKFFLIGWTFFLSSIVVFVLKEVGVLPYNLFTSHVLQFGSGMEVVMLSFGLADLINVLKKESEENQAKALEASMKSERLVKEQNVVLEKTVAKRTSELRTTNKELNQTLDTLKNAQSQLVEKEKMASLGQLTAGIAHEINNPINFVTANVKPLRRDIDDILEVLDKYDSINEPQSFNSLKEEIEELKEDLEIDYLRDEISSLLQGIEDGANRTAEIVKGLKVFSRLDEQDLKNVSIAQGIESTIRILGSSIPQNIEISKEFESVSRVECYAGKINQVFMNLITNSVDAIKTKKEQDGGKIVIRIKDAGKNLSIEIEDNGVGIDEDQKSKIYDPFYTTKDVGEGTGLGLSITHGIIDSHNGEIECISEKGQGTKFIITLPKTQSTNNPN